MLTTAQEGDDTGRTIGDLVLVDAIDLYSLDLDGTLNQATLSPDGSTIISGGLGDLCVLDVDTLTSECTIFDDELPQVLAFIWSPDSRFVALEHTGLRTLTDGDIVLYDVENNQLINRTDDGEAQIGTFGMETDGPEPLLDIAPTWGDENGDLYFVRYRPREDDLETLMRIPGPGSGSGLMGMNSDDTADELTTDSDPEIITQLSGTLDLLSVYMNPPVVFDGPMAVSPDGTQMALSVRPIDRDSTQRGIWILDLESDEFTQIASSEQFYSLGLPTDEDGEDIPLDLHALEWTADGIFVFGWDSMFMGTGVNQNLFFIDDETFEISPVFDLSGFGDFRDYATREETNGLIRPMFANIMPDESAILYADQIALCRDFGSACGLWAIPLPYDPDFEPVLLTEMDPEALNPLWDMSIGQNDTQVRVLIHNMVYTFEYQQ